MAESTTPLRRTAKGRDEILHKSHALTQSERLVLASVDGAAPAQTIMRKLSGMAERRFKLVLADLVAKGLIEDVVSPGEPESPLSPAALERYVRQEPTDPVSASSLHVQPNWSGSETLAQVEPRPIEAPVTASSPAPISEAVDAKPPALSATSVEGKGVDFYLPLEPLADYGRQPRSDSPMLISGNDDGDDQASALRRARREKRGRRVQIGYWLLFAGLVCLMILLIAIRNR